MPLYIGIDDTDYPEGGCTTWTSQLLAKIIEEEGAKIIERRLVRLWPFAPRRTRGNGAVCLVIEAKNPSSIIEIVKFWFNSMIEELKQLDEGKHARPGVVILEDQNSDVPYWMAVRSEVRYSNIEHYLEDSLMFHHHPDGAEGLIGALAAASWIPDSSVTWEAIAWRMESRWGTPRLVSPSCLEILESDHPETFMNRDPSRGQGLISPRSPCPVLFGIRARTQVGAIDAIENILCTEDTESAQCYAIFKTNQCSDDHLLGSLKTVVMKTPKMYPGGHVLVSGLTEDGPLLIRCFKEGGELRNALLSLEAGDVVEVLGLHSPDGEFHLERMRRITLSPRNLRRPICQCGTRFRSSGRNNELRCKECGISAPRRWVTDIVQISGWVEPTSDHRRHLAKPVSWMGKH